MINLEKGSKINLSKEAGLVHVRAGLGWDADTSGGEFDLDVSAYVCRYDASGKPKLISDDYFVFYNNKNSPNGAVSHSGDNRNGEGVGDDETIKINLEQLKNVGADEVSVIVTIHKAIERSQTFGKVKNTYIKIYNDDDGAEIAKFQLNEQFSSETAVQVGSFYRENGEFTFKAIGQGFSQTLMDICRVYGANV